MRLRLFGLGLRALGLGSSSFWGMAVWLRGSSGSNDEVVCQLLAIPVQCMPRAQAVTLIRQEQLSRSRVQVGVGFQ